MSAPLVVQILNKYVNGSKLEAKLKEKCGSDYIIDTREDNTLIKIPEGCQLSTTSVMNFYVHRQERTREAANIRDLIKSELSRLKKKYPKGEQYVADNDLPKWVTTDAVGKWIETSNIEWVDKPGIKERICKVALKTFCILVEIEKEDWIKYFIERGDSAGPDSMLWGITSESLKIFLREASPQQMSDSWPEAKCEEFCEVKWKYLAFRFTYGDRSSLPDKTILPFRMTECHQERGESTLFRIDFDRQYFRGPVDDLNVIKMMRKEIALEAGKKEADFIRYLHAHRKQPCPHIIELYAYYEHKGKANLLMPLLQGDLKGLLTKDAHVAQFQSDDRYLAEMLNLSRAVASVHKIEASSLYNITVVHHDLKPDNVLLHEGKFVLSDFGIANARCPTTGQEQESYGNISWWLAPEISWKKPWQGAASSKSDVFSLGCIFTELLVHMRGKAQSVMNFREQRRPNKEREAAPFCVGEQVNTEVLLELENIQRDRECVGRAQYAGVVLQMLKANPACRLSAEEVVAKFQVILGEIKPEPTVAGDANLQQFYGPSMTLLASQLQPTDVEVTKPIVSSPIANESCSVIDSLSHSRVRTIGTRAEKGLTVAQAISALGEQCEHESSIEFFLRTKLLNIAQQGRIKYIWKHKPWVQDWAKKPTSCCLFLQGDRPKDEKVLSGIAAGIIKSAKEVQEPSKLIVLQHFCRENRKNGERSICMMMQSLLRQLLSHRSGLDLLDPCSDTFSGIRNNVKSLQKMFEEVISKLGDGMTGSCVVCVIDNLQAYFDRSTRETRAQEAEETLLRLMEFARYTRVCFKLLFTASQKSVAVRLAQHGRIGAVEIHSIGDDSPDHQSLKPQFWKENLLTWA